MTTNRQTVVLFRPTGPDELELVRGKGFSQWPPRLPGQDIFYPVTNEEYAIQIARDWNRKESGAGFVTRFEVDAEFMRQFPIETVGAADHTEWWVPADRLDDLNANIVGKIEVIHEFLD